MGAVKDKPRVTKGPTDEDNLCHLYWVPVQGQNKFIRVCSGLEIPVHEWTDYYHRQGYDTCCTHTNPSGCEKLCKVCTDLAKGHG